MDELEAGSREKRRQNGWAPDLTVIGMGRVGLITALSFAAKGHRVLGVDLNYHMVARLREGQPSFFEPGLHELLTKVLDSGNLEASETYDERLSLARIHFICVDTGSVDGIALDLTNLCSALQDLSPYVRPDAVVALRSTVPPGTTEAARRLLSKNGGGPSVACNPEFLREGSAVEDFFNPDRGGSRRDYGRGTGSPFGPLAGLPRDEDCLPFQDRRNGQVRGQHPPLGGSAP